MQDKPEPRRESPAPDTKMPPAGPHAKEELIDREKTPGTGALPDEGEHEADVGPD